MSFSVVLQGGGIPQTSRVSVASRLVFVIQPGSATSGVVFATQPVVQVQDDSGGLILNASNAVTFTASPGTIGGTTPLNAVAGVCSPTDLKITGVGTDTLTAAASGLTSAVSLPFDVA